MVSGEKKEVYIVYANVFKVYMKVPQLCPTLCDPPEYTVHGILQAGILEWVAFTFSRGSSRPRKQTQIPELQADSLPTELSGISI